MVGEEIGKAIDVPQRRPQVVRHRIRKCLQLGIGGAQLVVGRLHLLRTAEDLRLHAFQWVPGFSVAVGGRLLLPDKIGDILDTMDDVFDAAVRAEHR